jgi:hypothetical protein
MSKAEDLRVSITIYRERLVRGSWKAAASVLLLRDIAAARKELERIEKDDLAEKDRFGKTASTNFPL